LAEEVAGAAIGGAGGGCVDCALRSGGEGAEE